MLVLCSFALAETDTLGGDDEYNNEGDMLKLVSIDVEEAVVITALDVPVYNYGSEGDIVLVAYHLEDGEFGLIGEAEAMDLPSDAEGYAWTGDISWLLEAGETYAIGMWIADSWYYYYSDNSDEPWFGELGPSYRYESDDVPETFEPGDEEDYYYWMDVTSEPADADGDGVIAEQWGGEDCDDEDATVGAPTTEVPYDGLDQDCDGLDLVDVDGDGVAAVEAAGEDCDDTSAAVGPGQVETCDDGIDQDCSGEDEFCELATPGGCGCNSGADAGALVLALAAMAALRRRAWPLKSATRCTSS